MYFSIIYKNKENVVKKPKFKKWKFSKLCWIKVFVILFWLKSIFWASIHLIIMLSRERVYAMTEKSLFANINRTQMKTQYDWILFYYDTIESNKNMAHEHCDSCVKVTKCDARDSCAMVACDNSLCCQRMHSCKLNDHLLICSYHKVIQHYYDDVDDDNNNNNNVWVIVLCPQVSCLNAWSGCGAIVTRKDMAKHLTHCPASVIHCSVEWNRWPTHTRERRVTRAPHMLSDVHHLDVALALRDQRMLKQLFQAERRTQKMMRNCLTQKYPAVPLKVIVAHLNFYFTHDFCIYFFIYKTMYQILWCIKNSLNFHSIIPYNVSWRV